MRLALIPLLLTSLLSTAAVPALAAPRLVKDLNTGPATDTFPDFSLGITNLPGYTRFHDGVLYFRGFDPAHGVELWRSDGTAAGTYRLTDICPGRCSSNLVALEISQGHVFLSATDGATGYELWRSDGIPGSEVRVRDLCVGPCSSDPYDLLDLGGTLLFTAFDTSHRAQLWRTDGSRRGTALLATLCPPASVNAQCVGGMQRIGDRAVFVAYDSTTQKANVWSSDGTPEGTGPLGAGIAGGLPSVVRLPVANGTSTFFFSQFDLWRTDGTAAGTVRVKELQQLVADLSGLLSAPAVVWNGALYLFVDEELVRSDGTNLGTVRLDAFPHLSVVSQQIAPLDDVLLFLNEGPDAARALWAMDRDGAAEKIFQIDSSSGYINDVVPLGDHAVFRVRRASELPFELWETDGTAAGTHQILEAQPGSTAFEMLSVGTEAFLAVGGFPSGTQIWTTDGTTAGTVLVRDFAAGPGSSGPLAQAALGGALVFSAQTGEHDAPLFRSDGTAAGTRRLSNQAQFGRGFTQVGNRLFFASSLWGFLPGNEVLQLLPNGLWSTNGAGSTVQVAPSIVSYEPRAVLGDKLLFSGGDTVPQLRVGADLELWISDGAGTRRLKNINPFQFDTGFHHACGEAGSEPSPGVVLGTSGNGRFVFTAEDGIHGRELWVSDGTPQGTRLVSDINPRRSQLPPEPNCDDRATTGLSSDPSGFVAFRGGALFTADDGVHGRELWRTDGTAAGTRRVRDLRPGAQGSNPHDLVAFRGAVYFIASTQAKGETLWRTDGTAAGTVQVDDLRIGTLPSWAQDLTVAGNQLFFAATNEATGTELWASRGDAASTRLVTDLRPGAPGSYPRELTAVGNVLVYTAVFSSSGGAHGVEPWRSDGTAAGTRPLGDLNPGADSSSPGPFTRAGGFVFTGAYDAEHGRELWAIPLADVQ